MPKRGSLSKSHTPGLIILLVCLCLATVLPAAAQTPLPPTLAGNEAREKSASLQIGFHLGQGDAEHMQAARAAGAGFVVVVFSWANIEPEPNYLYWELPDAAVRAAEFYGLELIARLDQPPDWALDSSDPTPWRLEAYANFARRVAERYGRRLAGLILWNEPNLSLEWHNQPPDAAAYVEMLKAAYPAVKAAAPDLPVLLGGLASTEGEGDWAINDLDYLQALYAAGAEAYFDVLTAHPYGFGRAPDDPPAKYHPNFRRLEMYRQIMEANNDAGKPIWVTEMSWLTWTDNPKHEWQVVTPEVQAAYFLGAIAYAQENYPWLERLGFWELNSAGDDYGYGIWRGPDRSSPAYEALVATCASRSQRCRTDPATANRPDASVSILAPDVAIRLGDRPTLYPHWIHLYRGGGQASLKWQGEFFLTTVQAGRAYDLRLETMAVGQASDRLWLNDRELGSLQPRPRPDPTSAWITQRFSLPSGLLRAGVNHLALAVGPRNPARQYSGGRWENMEFRNVRLVATAPLPAAIWQKWQSLPAPSGWSETNRLRPDPAGGLWLTGARPGELWLSQAAATPLALTNQAGNRPDLVFNDLLPLVEGELAATGHGLFWRGGRNGPPPGPAQAVRPGLVRLGDRLRLWRSAAGAPDDFAYVVTRANGRVYAGFENEGLWSTPGPGGPWQRTALTATTVVDLAVGRYQPPDRVEPVDRLYVLAGQEELWVNNGLGDEWQALPLPGLSAAALDEAGESQADKFWPHLFTAPDGQVVIRSQDRLWRLSDQDPAGWVLVGPDQLAGKLLSLLNCCDPGALAGANKAGLWQEQTGGEWQRLDDGFFETTDLTDLLQVGGNLYAAGELGLFESAAGRSWQKAAGLPPVVSDLLVDPAEPTRWLAGTPAGVYRSQDRGQSWQVVSPPWTIWDMAFGPQGRLFLGRSNGLAWSDDLGATPIVWHPAEGMERVAFLSLNPNPADARQVWTGTWGNNIGASNDGGQSVAPLHHGLETLTGLDLIWHPTPGQVTLATLAGLYRTDDGGQSWFPLPGPLAQQTVYSLLQTDDGAIWAGTADGLWLSRDYGTTWTRVRDIPPAAVIRLGKLPPAVELLPLIPPLRRPILPPLVSAPAGWLWAGTEAAGWWLSQDGGHTWHLGGLAGRTVYNLFVDPLPPGRLVAATDRGILAVSSNQ